MAKKIRKFGMSKGRSRLVDEGDQLLKYFDDGTQRAIAKNSGNIDAQYNIIQDHLKANEPSLLNLFTDSYHSEVVNFIERIEALYPEEVEKKRKEVLGIGERGKKVGIRKRRKSRRRLAKNITQKSRTGRVYSRSYMKWSRAEETYLTTRKTEDVEKIQVDLSEISGFIRTDKSIKAKMHRKTKKGGISGKK